VLTFSLNPAQVTTYHPGRVVPRWLHVLPRLIRLKRVCSVTSPEACASSSALTRGFGKEFPAVYKATTTLNTYAHLWPTAEDRTRQAAGAMLISVFGSISNGQATAQEA
jgi:hypothetical protein